MRRVAISRLLAFVCLAFASLSAQEFSFRTFGNAEGLSNLAVRQLYEDRAGFMWVSTENGIFRYDGDRFEAFGPAQGLPETSGAAFGEAPDGSLLAGGSFGLYRLHGNRFEKLPVPFQYRQLGARHPVGRGRPYFPRYGVGIDGTGFRTGTRRIYGARPSRASQELRGPRPMQSWWMAPSSGTDADMSCAARTRMGRKFSDAKSAFQIVPCL